LDSDGPGLNTHDGGTRLKSRKCKRTDNLGEKEGDVNTHNEGEQDEHVSPLHGLDSTEDANIQALKDELAIAEAKLGELLDSSQAVVETRGKEMSALVSVVEDSEEEFVGELELINETRESIEDALIDAVESTLATGQELPLEDIERLVLDTNKLMNHQLASELVSLLKENVGQQTIIDDFLPALVSQADELVSTLGLTAVEDSATQLQTILLDFMRMVVEDAKIKGGF